MGGDGDDTLSFGSKIAALRVNLAAGTAVGAETGEDSFGGIETFIGGDGNDTLSFEGDTAGVTADLLGRIAFATASGIVTFESFENLAGGDGNDTLTGDMDRNEIEGGVGKDILRGQTGNDTLLGGDGEDTLIGGDGLDRLFGGAGSDVFDFDAVWESPPNPLRDVIGDFENAGADHGDQIDVSDIAAFAFIGTGSFTGTGGAELRVVQVGANTLVAGDFNGDAAADFEIQVNATSAGAFAAEDFLMV